MNKELLASIFRNFLRAAIGAAVTAGYIQPGVITDQTTMEIGGAIAFCILEWWSHRKKQDIKAVASVQAVEATKAVAIDIVKQGTAPITSDLIAQQISNTEIRTKETK